MDKTLLATVERLLEDLCAGNFNDHAKAMVRLTTALAHALKVSLKAWCKDNGVEFHNGIDFTKKLTQVGSSIDWSLQICREKKLTEFVNVMVLLEESFINKFNDDKGKFKNVYWHGIFEDLTLHRQLRCGVYALVEVDYEEQYEQG